MNTFAYCVRSLSVLGLMAVIFSAARASEDDSQIPPPPAPDYGETVTADEAEIPPPPAPTLEDHFSGLNPEQQVLLRDYIKELQKPRGGQVAVEDTEDEEVLIEADPLARKLEELAASEDDPIIRRRGIEYSPDPVAEGKAWFLDPPAQRKDYSGPFVVKSDPCVTEAEMRQDFNDKLEVATREYINNYLGANNAAMLVGYDMNEVRWYISNPDNMYQGTLDSPSVGTMHQQGALVEFDDNFRRDLEQKWNKVVATARLGRVGLIGVGVFGFLAIAFSYFKLDTATRGYYSGRLKLLAITTVVGLLAAGIFAQKLFPWI